MVTVRAGLAALRRRPEAAAPAVAEGVLGAVLVALGAWPAGATAAPATAAFPLGIYFDVEVWLTRATGWVPFVAIVAAGVVVRSGVVAATVWLADGRPGPFAAVWRRAGALGAAAALALAPAATLSLAGLVMRYAPFTIAAAALGVVAAAEIARRAVALDAGAGRPGARAARTAFLAYVYVVTACGALLALLSHSSRVAVAAGVAALGPLHALFVVGWRERARAGDGRAARAVAALTGIVVVALAALVLDDRLAGRPAPRGGRGGVLLLLGGVDSTSRTGALAGFDARAVGLGRAVTVSYRGERGPYDAADTRRDLDGIARAVAGSVAARPRPRALLGHSQASLIVDRIVAVGLAAPDVAVVLAGPPPAPPGVRLPPPGASASGAPGADALRALARVLDAARLPSFDVDAPAAPDNLRRVVAPSGAVRRLSVWALLDSVWLTGDWRRPGEVDVVALSDHVGVVRDERALDAAADFFAGRPVGGDDGSWRGVAVLALRYAFEPWRAR